jgi:hypothetical protein
MNITNIYRKTGKSGSIKWILLIFIALVVASYFFDFSVQEAIEDEQTQSNFGYIKDNALYFYDTYLRNIFEYIWNMFTENMSNMQNGEPTVFDEAAANLNIGVQ